MTSFIRKLHRPAFAAKRFGVPKSTLASAISSGALKTVETGCGLKLVAEQDVKRWLRDNAGRGRPRGNYEEGRDEDDVTILSFETAREEK